MTSVAQGSRSGAGAKVLPEGIWPVVSTPYRSDGEIDPAALAKLVRFLTATGVSALTLFGFGSEAYKLADRERMQLLEVVRENSGPLPLIVTVSDHATRVASARARAYAENGASALMVLPPYFQAPSVAARSDHTRAIAEAADLPLILQVAPPITGQSFSPSDLARLAETIPTLRYVKVEEVEPVRYLRAMHELGMSRPQPVLGYGGRSLPQVAGLGVHALQPGDALPEYYLKMWDARFDSAKLRRLYAPILELQDVGGTLESLVVANKHLLMKRGLLADDHCRAPTISLQPEQVEWLDGVLRGVSEMLKDEGVIIETLDAERTEDLFDPEGLGLEPAESDRSEDASQ